MLNRDVEPPTPSLMYDGVQIMIPQDRSAYKERTSEVYRTAFHLSHVIERDDGKRCLGSGCQRLREKEDIVSHLSLSFYTDAYNII